MMNETSPDTLTEQEIVNYLIKNPDFFERHEALLTRIKLPHGGRGKTVSLVERQLIVLRDENQHLNRQLEILIETAKRNEELNQRIQRIILALLGASNFEQFLSLLYETLLTEFKTDAVALRLFGVSIPALANRTEFAEYDAEVFQLFENILNSSKPFCGRPSAAQNDYLFPRQKIGSAVLLPLGLPKAYGLLALASQDVARYHAGMATDLLKYLGDIISYLLRNWQTK